MRKILIALTMVPVIAASAAHGEEQMGAGGAMQAPPSAPSASQAQEPAASPSQNSSDAGAQVEKHSHAASPAHDNHTDPAYAQKLAAAIRAHVAPSTNVGAGTASCNFQVTASGSISGINCKGSSPAHSQLLQRAIASTKAAPPPGGSFSANQSIVFH